MAAPIQVISSLQDVANALEGLHIDAIAQANQVRFELGEQTPLSEAAKIKARTEPGRQGFVLVNHELLACKFRTKVTLETEFNRMLDASLRRIDEELVPVEDSIAALRVLVQTADPQMPANNGPPLVERGQGTQHCIYPAPPFPVPFSFEHADHNHRVPYVPAYATPELRAEAAARDRRAQRAIWAAKLRVLVVRQAILKERKTEMVLRMKEEYNRMMDEQSDLGVGYADFAFPPLA